MKKLHVFGILFFLTICCLSLNGVYAVDTVAEINGTGYFDIHNAVAAAKNGDVVQILKSVEINEPIVVSGKHISIISVGNNVLLRNKKFLGNMVEVDKGASLSIGEPLATSNKNSSMLTFDGNKTGTGRHSSSPDDHGSIIKNNGKLILKDNLKFINNFAYSAQFQTKCKPVENGKYGAIYNDSELIINGTYFRDNSSVLGGAIFNSEYGSVLFINGSVTKNTGLCGAGIFNAGRLVFIDGKISKNIMGQKGGGIFNSGDLIVKSGKIIQNVDQYHSFSPDNPPIALDWVDPYVLVMGGGLFNMGNCLIEGGEISGNMARNGGGIANYKTLHIFSVIIANNTANALYRLDRDFPFPSERMRFGCLRLEHFGNGGGILNVGTLEIDSGAQIFDNQANVGSGIIHRYCKAIINNSLYIHMGAKIEHNVLINPLKYVSYLPGKWNEHFISNKNNHQVSFLAVGKNQISLLDPLIDTV